MGAKFGEKSHISEKTWFSCGIFFYSRIIYAAFLRCWQSVGLRWLR